MIRMKYILILFLVSILSTAYGQSPSSNDLGQSLDDNFVDPDSVDYDSYTKKTSSFKALFNGDPGRTILYGLLAPGGGQIYNRDYWKVPIAWAAEGTAIGTFIYFRRTYNQIDEAYRLRVMGEEADYRGITAIESLFNFRTRFQKLSEQAGVVVILIHVLVAVESYIDKHLSVFDIDEDLTIDYSAPGINNASRIGGLSLTYSF